MLNASISIEKNGVFSIAEKSSIYKVPFDVIYNTGRRLFFYSDKNNDTPVSTWYNRLNDQYKKKIAVLTN